METAFVEFLRRKMREMDLNNKGVAALVDVSPSVVGDWLDGTVPKAESVIRLAAATRADPLDLLALAYGLPQSGEDLLDDENAERLLRKLEKLTDDERVQAESFIDYLLTRVRRDKNARGDAAAAKT